MEIKLRAKNVIYPKGLPTLPSFIVYAPKPRRADTDIMDLKQTSGAAVDLNKDIALSRAVSETLERYCLTQFKEECFIEDSFEMLKGKAISLEKFILYSKKQYKKKDFEFIRPIREEKTRWILAKKVNENYSKYVPADFVYPRSRINIYPRIDSWSSNGAAASENINEALTNAICELIERDSTMCFWLTKSGLAGIPEKYFKSNKKISLLRNLIHKKGFRLKFFFIINEMNMVTSMAIIKSDKKPYYSFGSSCKLNIELSMERAIEEAIMILRTQKILLKKRYKTKRHNIKTLQDHVMVPCVKKYYSDFLFLEKLKSAPVKKLKNYFKCHPKSLKQLVSRLAKNNYETYYVDVATPKVKQAGYFACKAIIPGLHPLEIDHYILHADFRRVKKFLCHKSMGKITFNYCPHPFG